MALDQTDEPAREQTAPGQRAEARLHFDAVVVGTGFGGAVTACRLVEAGFKVCVLERGRRYGPAGFSEVPDRRPLCQRLSRRGSSSPRRRTSPVGCGGRIKASTTSATSATA